MKILLTEDHLDTAKVMRLILEKYGLEVRTAGCLKEALEFAEAEQFDLLIADVRLPDGDGFALCNELHQRQKLKSICLSGDVARPSIESGEGNCFNAYLAKPIDVAELLATIQKITGWKPPA